MPEKLKIPLAYKAFLENNAHISDAEALQDIADTEREIKEIIETNGLAHPSSLFPKINSSTEQRLKERTDFIKMVRKLLRLRKIYT